MIPNPIPEDRTKSESLTKKPCSPYKKIDAETLKNIHNSVEKTQNILDSLEKIDPAYQEHISPKHPDKDAASLKELRYLEEEILRIRREKMELLIQTIRREIPEKELPDHEIQYDQKKGVLTIFEYDIFRGPQILNIPSNKFPPNSPPLRKNEFLKTPAPQNTLNDPIENILEDIENHLSTTPFIHHKEDPQLEDTGSIREEAQKITRDDRYISEKFRRLELGYYPAPPKLQEIDLGDRVEIEKIPQTKREFTSRTRVMNKVLEIIKRLNRKS